MGIDRLSRRGFTKISSAALAMAATRPAWAMASGHQHHAAHQARHDSPSMRLVDLTVDQRDWRIGNRLSTSYTLNGQMPGPLLRWTEGDDVTIRVHNALTQPTSIHWHGLLLPFDMDGVPGLSFDGIPPGERFDYRFRLRQSGTYWYHSHSGFQEQRGHLGPLIIDPAGNAGRDWDREHVIVLSDWTFDSPETVFRRLKKLSHGDNRQQRTVADFWRNARAEGWSEAISDSAMWGRMRMDPTDLADVTATTYTYLVNGQPPTDPWLGDFTPGERVRLRIINGSAMTLFNIRLPGLPMEVVQSDGQEVDPVTVDELQIGVAETFDVIVQPERGDAYALVAESIDRSGLAVAQFTAVSGARAPVPALRERPTLTMRDMAMSHGSHGSHGSHQNGHATKQDIDRSKQSSTQTPAEHEHSMPKSAQHQPTAHAGQHGTHSGQTSQSTTQDLEHLRGPGVVGIAEQPANRLHEPPLGLADVPHRVLRYSQLKARDPNTDERAPKRELELHLTGNMERYMWSFDGQKFSEVNEPIRFQFNERVRLNLTNHTMMAHPIHLHGMFVELVAGHGLHNPRKHTVVVKPGERLSVDLTANEPGPWAFHCHLLYHMVAGMMRIVLVDEPA